MKEAFARDQTLREVAEVGVSVFFAHVAASYPDVTTGDLPPDAYYAFEQAAVTAVVAWLDANSPEN
jgi:hypothetical protein